MVHLASLGTLYIWSIEHKLSLNEVLSILSAIIGGVLPMQELASPSAHPMCTYCQALRPCPGCSIELYPLHTQYSNLLSSMCFRNSDGSGKNQRFWDKRGQRVAGCLEIAWN